MKWIGALLVIAACGGWGFLLAAGYRRQERLLAQVLDSISWLQCELQCRATDLPSLFLRGAERTGGLLGELFETLSQELSCRVAPDAFYCIQNALEKVELPEKPQRILLQLGRSLGEFHLEGQLQQLAALEAECSRILEEHRRSGDSRIRSYQTIGICSGLALAILLL